MAYLTASFVPGRVASFGRTQDKHVEAQAMQQPTNCFSVINLGSVGA